MAKTEADSLNKITTTFLKQYGYFDSTGSVYGIISWTRSGMGSKSESSVGIQVKTEEYGGYLRIFYTQTDKQTKEGQNFDCKVSLTTTPCYLGGKRYWFICPLSKNNIPCGRRVGKLYKGGDYFGCRHCYDLTYERRNFNTIERMCGRFMSDKKLKELYNSVRVKFYKGKPTKRYLRYLKEEAKNEKAWRIAEKYFGVIL